VPARLPAIADTCGLARRSLIQLRPETFRAHHMELTAEVTDPVEPGGYRRADLESVWGQQSLTTDLRTAE
jgi:hypothetical protein